MNQENWTDVGAATELAGSPISKVRIGKTEIAISFKDGQFGAVSNVCNHVGGPLGEGRLDGDYVVCPWHNWKYHRCTGQGEPGSDQDFVPSFPVKVENGRLLIDLGNVSKRVKSPHPHHPLERRVVRAPGPLRLLGLSTTAMDPKNPRFSSSDHVLQAAIDAAKSLGAETQTIKLNDLKFRTCEGYYSKSARACTWPCSITQMDVRDGMTRVYEALVHWSDAVIVATPIRWGAASSLYFKMAERLNCIQFTIGFLFATRSRDSSSSAVRTTYSLLLDKCSASLESSATYFLSFHMSHILAAGRMRTWKITCASLKTPGSFPKAQLSWLNVACHSQRA